MLRAEATVDFSTLGADLGNILPSISTEILIDFGFGWSIVGRLPGLARRRSSSPTSRSTSARSSPTSPGRSCARSSRCSTRSAWLIGPDGFLNMRIPLLSDLAGKTITGADLVYLFDPEDAPTSRASSTSSTRSTTWSISSTRRRSRGRQAQLRRHGARRGDAGPATPTRISWAICRLDLHTVGLPSTAEHRRRAEHQRPAELRQTSALPGLAADAVDPGGRAGSATSQFTPGVTGGGVDFPILEQPVDPLQPAARQAGHAGRGHAAGAQLQLPLPAAVPDHRAARRAPSPAASARSSTCVSATTRTGCRSSWRRATRPTCSRASSSTPKDAQGNPLPVATAHRRDRRRRGAVDRRRHRRRRGRHRRAHQLLLERPRRRRASALNEMAANVLANGGDPLAVFDITGDLSSSSGPT